MICKFYPYGGGVYASVRDRSRVLSIIGAFFLISDYIVTASLSSLSALNYLGVSHPEIWAMLSIFIIGLLNFLGPKQTGSLAIALAIPTVVCVFCLALITLPFLPKAIHHLAPMSHHIERDWNIFVGIIVALSGIEAIANTTSSMKLDPGFTYRHPSVIRTSTPAIIMVILEVCFFTALLGLAMNALPGLYISEGTVNAPNYPNVRDAMLRYMAETFAGTLFGAPIGVIFGFVISIVITLLLLSAVNTAMIALCSLLFVMSRDGETPLFFQKLNRFGVPVYALGLAFLFPIGILIFVHDIAGLANLYAIGFVGAITVNLGATSTNPKIPLQLWQRIFMMVTFFIMALVEITLFFDKPEARAFVITIMGIGLILRALVAEQKEKEVQPEALKTPLPLPPVPTQTENAWMVATTGKGKSLDYAMQESQARNIPLYVLFVREQKVLTEEDQKRTWKEDVEAREIYDYILSRSPKNPMEFLYTITPHTAHSIGEIAIQKKVDSLIIGKARRSFPLLHMLRGTTVRDVARYLPDDIKFIVVY